MTVIRAILPAVLCMATLGAWSGASAADEGKPGYVAPHVMHDAYGDVHIVVALTSDDKGLHGMKMRNITNGIKAAEQWQGKADVKLVLYSRGVSLLRDPDEATRAKLDFLRSHGVQILVCNNTLAENGIDFHTLYNVSDADIVPSGFLEVAYLQAAKHYVVDPVN